MPVASPHQFFGIGEKLMAKSIAGSGLLLCVGRSFGGIDHDCFGVFTAEGLEADVMEELSWCLDFVESSDRTWASHDISTGDIWAQFMGGSSADTGYVKAGVPPKALAAVLREVEPALDDTGYILDVANGFIYARSTRDWKSIRQAALGRGGYAIKMGGEGCCDPDSDPWGAVPESLNLMKTLKTNWDPNHLANPGVFLV
jgi:hypothetical protein